MRRQTEQGKERLPVGWVLLAVLCMAAFWLGQAFVAARAGSGSAVPNDLFASGGRAGGAAPADTPAGPTPAPASDADATQEAEALPPKTICLTFDDGPSANTEKILEILQQYDVPATFFVVAYEGNRKYMPQIATIVERGHQLAMHSASHDYEKIYQSPSAFWLDIKELRQALEPYADVEKIRWLRFPGGSTNTVSHRYGGKGIMQELKEDCAEKGYEWIDWNVSAEDATRKHPDAAQILKNIQNDAQGRDICVVLMHDTKATGETVKALPDVIAWFQEEGYTFLTVEQMDARRQAAGQAESAPAA